jgi:hypothetical protein
MSNIKLENNKFSNNEYAVKRKSIIEMLKSLVKNFNLTNSIYHLSIYLIDSILHKFLNLKTDLVVIACLMLASNEF